MTTATTLGCIHHYWDPSENPYRLEQSAVLVVLVLGLFVWLRVRPKPTRVVAGYMTVCAIATMYFSALQICALQVCGDALPYETAEWIILQACTALAACMCIELFRTVRKRRAAVLAVATAIRLRR